MMDTAICTIDSTIWKADNFFALGESNIRVMRRNLKCVECDGDAWFRKSSYGNKVPHFCAHHTENCSLATNYEVIDQGDGEGKQPATNPDSGITINLGSEENYSIDVEKVDPTPYEPKGQKLTGNRVKNSGGIEYPAHLSLKNILFKLVRSDKRYSSDMKVAISNSPFADLPQKACDLFVNFKDVHKGLENKNRVYWGFISDAAYTSDGKLWLNAGNRTDGLSVAIRPEITDKFRDYFKVDDSLEQLCGCHALVIGDCYYAGSGKPIIWCSSLDFIVLRRYNFT